MSRARYKGKIYFSVTYRDTEGGQWVLLDDGRETALWDVGAADMEVECQSCGRFTAEIAPRELGRWVCDNCVAAT